MITPTDQTVVAEETVTWRCVVAANPSAQITWRKDGNTLNRSSGVQISQGGNELGLKAVDRQDAGEYTCRAENNIGQNTVSAALEVHGETCHGTFVVALCSHAISVTSVGAKIVSSVVGVDGLVDSFVSMPCMAHGYPSPLMEWRRDGVSVGARPPYKIFSNGTLRIENVKQADSGSYLCVASNVAGTDMKIIQLDVHCKYRQCCPPCTNAMVTVSVYSRRSRHRYVSS